VYSDVVCVEERVVYYESMKRNLKIKPIYECRCDGSLQTKRFTCLSYTGLVKHVLVQFVLMNSEWFGLHFCDAITNIGPFEESKGRGGGYHGLDVAAVGLRLTLADSSD
jgi:hypothetical protein